LIIKVFFYLQDFRLSSNTHYFLFWLQSIYLFIPNKEAVLKTFLILYYMASGLIKLSPEWLTGQWFLQHRITRVKLAEWCAAISVLIEIIASSSLLFRRGRYFLIGLLALVAYHGAQWWLDGFFPAMVHLLGLSFFMLLYWDDRRLETEYLYHSYARPEPSRAWVFVIVLVFFAAQVSPFLPAPSTRWAPILDLARIDRLASNADCRMITFAKYADRTEQVQLAGPTARPAHQQCSAYLRFLDLRQSCQELAKREGFRTIAAYFEMRNLKDADFHRVFEIDDFCKPDLKYRDLGLVTWNMTRTTK
jgi:hypothetical protein